MALVAVGEVGADVGGPLVGLGEEEAAAEVRVDVSTMMRGFSNPVGFADGSNTNPIIARRAQTSVGIRFAASTIALSMASNDSLVVDNSTTAGDTRLLVYDVDNATVERVSVGAADSGGAGFKVLRIPN